MVSTITSKPKPGGAATYSRYRDVRNEGPHECVIIRIDLISGTMHVPVGPSGDRQHAGRVGEVLALTQLIDRIEKRLDQLIPEQTNG